MYVTNLTVGYTELVHPTVTGEICDVEESKQTKCRVYLDLQTKLKKSRSKKQRMRLLKSSTPGPKEGTIF